MPDFTVESEEAVMIAAIYARKSTDQSDVSDAEKSVTRQISLAKAFAAEKGWQVIEEYMDEGISGQESAKLVNRARMLADATQGKFSVVIVRDYDRISRDDREGPSFVYMLRDAGVEVWEYVSRAPIKVDRAMDRTMLNMKAGFAAHEAEAASDRTREQKRAKASLGEIADGRVLGYRTVGEAKARRREIDPAPAEIVRRIFTLCAEGKGLLKIAKTLNAEGVKNPTGQIRKIADADGRVIVKKTNADLWATTGIREVLHRDLYRGVVVYGRTRNLRRLGPQGGKRTKIAAEALTVERPELRIVSDELWNTVRERLVKTRAAYERRNNGQLCSKPESGLESKYLLSGFLRCGVCQGAMMINKRTSKRGRPQLVYVCATHRTRGDAACGVKEALAVTDVDTAVVRGLREVLTPERLETVIREYVAEYAAGQSQADGQRSAVLADLARLDNELTNLNAALARFGADVPASVLDGIKARNVERRNLGAKLEHLDGMAKAADRVTPEAFATGLRVILKDWNTLMKADPASGRRALRDVQVGAIFVTRTPAGAWRYKITGGLSKILSGLFFNVTIRTDCEGDPFLDAGPVTFTDDDIIQAIDSSGDPEVQYRWCPRGDSNTRHAV